MSFVILLASGRYFCYGRPDGTCFGRIAATKFKTEGKAREAAVAAGCTGFSIEVWNP